MHIYIYMEYLQFCLLSRGAFEGMWMQKIPAPLYIDRKSIVLAIRLCRKVSYSVFGINYACNIASRPGGGYTLGSDLLRNQRSPNSNSEWWTTRGVHSVGATVEGSTMRATRTHAVMFNLFMSHHVPSLWVLWTFVDKSMVSCCSCMTRCEVQMPSLNVSLVQMAICPWTPWWHYHWPRYKELGKVCSFVKCWH